ncbi:MAG TPA: hypothetical protein VG889_10160 [Rhizomicrobium sp.]|nr:hypothetical protein [Rhizomicrobium sp.]
MKRLALIVMLPLLSGCAVMEWFDEPILPDDVVKTEEDAIGLARAHCSPGPSDTSNWGASRDGDIWSVWWSHRQSSASAEIRKSDGEFLDCDVHLVPN